MDYNSIYLSRKEKRRFLEIAQGDKKASNAPEEDALIRKGLVRENMIAYVNLDTKSSTVDMRAVVLSDLGREYYAQYMNQQEINKKDSRRYWINTIIAVLGVIATVAGIAVTIWLAG